MLLNKTGNFSEYLRKYSGSYYHKIFIHYSQYILRTFSQRSITPHH